MIPVRPYSIMTFGSGGKYQMLTPDQENVIYRDNMSPVMEDLSVALWGLTDGPQFKSDAEIVEVAARKIELLKKMILSTGFNEALLKAILEDA